MLYSNNRSDGEVPTGVSSTRQTKVNPNALKAILGKLKIWHTRSNVTIYHHSVFSTSNSPLLVLRQYDQKSKIGEQNERKRE